MMYATIDELVAAGGIAGIDPTAPDDIYVCAASFEPRSMTLVSAFATGYRARWGCVYVNEDFLAGDAAGAVQGALDTLRGALEKRCGAVLDVRGSWENAAKQVGALRTAFGTIASGERVATVTVDATTFSREALIVCLALLRSQFPKARVRLLYVAPERHGNWLSRGFRKVRSVVGFAGVQQPSCSTVLLVLSGFEGDRTVKLIEEYEPTRVLLGIGDPPTIPGFLDRNIGEHRLVLARTDVVEFRFPADNTRACATVLEDKVRSELGLHNIVIAPMSTKLSTVAAFLVAERHPEVQIAYCLPGEYNAMEYSEGASHVYVEELEQVP